MTDTWPETLGILADDDVTVGVLDCPPGTPGCELDLLDGLAGSGIDVISLATLRADRTAPPNLEAAAARLLAGSIEPIGYGPNIAGAVAPAIFEGEGSTVAVHAIAFHTELAVGATDTSAGIAGPDAFAALLEAITVSDADKHRVVVAVDWGAEDSRAPAPAQVAIAEQLIDAGADAIIGNGSAFLQRLERIESIPVVYSLGDATTTALTQVERDTAVFRIEFGSLLFNTCLFPATAGLNGPVLDNPTERRCS